MEIIVSFILYFIFVLTTIILIYSIARLICTLSNAGANSFMYKITMLLYEFVKPLFNLVNKFLPGRYQAFTPIVAYLLLQLLAQLISSLMKWR